MEKLRLSWPHGKKFAFTIIDDTDNGNIQNLKPVYDLLEKMNIKTTKTVWVYPSRNIFTGGSLQDPDYLEFIKTLINSGFEIALHNVGSGSFTREEIEAGLVLFNQLLGFYPRMQINHASNPDNLYWGAERYQRAFKALMQLLYGDKRKYYGADPKSKYFWGDHSKKHIQYIRNYVFNGINTLKNDPQMPYKEKHKDKYSNYWFSSSDGHTVMEFNDLISSKQVDQLEREGGACIVYTHFASNFVDKQGLLDENFEKNIRYLATKDGWFAPASVLLDYILKRREKQNDYVSSIYLNKLDVKWTFDRLFKKIKYGI